jgi:hypothetical protein
MVAEQGGSRVADSVHTHLMFQNGRALESLRGYQEIFDGEFTIDELDTYDETAAGPTVTTLTRNSPDLLTETPHF